MRNEIKMGAEITREITAAELAEKTGKTVDLFRIKYAKLRATGHPLFADQFSRNAPLSDAQIELLSPAKRDIKNTDYESGVRPVKSGRKEEARANEPAPTLQPETRKWPLWIALAITAGASIPNMVEVTTAIKGSGFTARALTGVFTVIPGLLIAARLRGQLWAFVVVLVMGYTAFCNAAAIFGGLTSMDRGYIMQPTVFLEAVTNMLNTPYMATARALAGVMAVVIGAIEYVAFKNLSK